MTSWQVRLAALLAWLGVLPGLLCFYLAALAFRNPDDMLLFVMPIIGTAALVAGVVIVAGAASCALGLAAGKPRARLHALVGGACLAVCGVFTLATSPRVGILLFLYGGSLVWLMLSPDAVADLGSLRDALAQQQAPWGSRPGTRLWSSAPQQQGPWSPPPTTLPWGRSKARSGPTPPWWQTWQAALAQGIPLWELVTLVVAVVAVLTGNVLLLLGLTGSAYLGTLGMHGSGAPIGLLLVGAGVGVVTCLEKRMRRRLEGRVARH